MKTKIILFLSIIIFHFATNKSIAQNFNGKANIVEFTNATAKFTVPVGKTWIIQNIFSDETTNFKIINNNDGLEHCRVYVFIKTINGIIKTDIITEKNSKSLNNNNNAFHPIYLPENTTIEFIITYEDFIANKIKIYDGSATLNYIETTNQ
jgi:hypothetical protein